MNGIIYVLINEAMPGYVKIGKTSRDDFEIRIRELYTTGVPFPFECFYACTVKNADLAEKKLLEAFQDHRVNPRREFLEISPDRVVAALKLAEPEDVTPKKDYVDSPEEQQALNQAREKRSAFNFKMANIPVGAELTYVNDANRKAKVVDNKRIEFDGEVTSLSASAQKLLGYARRPAGPLFWKYEEETLDERRRRLENED